MSISKPTCDTLEVLLDQGHSPKCRIVSPSLDGLGIEEPAAEGDDAHTTRLQHSQDLSKNALRLLHVLHADAT